jgi:hypothetical protein
MSLYLIFAMMRGEQMETAVLAAPAGKQPIARSARCLLYAACRFLSRPSEYHMADSSRRQPTLKPPDFSGALRPEPMVHCQGTEFPTPFARPAIR